MFKFSLCVFLTLAASSAFAQHAHHNPNAPMEAGQSDFTAIAEIVEVLLEDPETDWTKVNISALQNHLVDMDLVTIRAKATAETNFLTVTLTALGEGETVGAIQRMTVAHAPMLAAETGWDIDTVVTTSGAIVHITVTSEADLARLVGLGFYGVMNIGAHHLQIVLGANPHP